MKRILALVLTLFLFQVPAFAQSDFLVETTFDVFFTTRRFSTGAPFALAGTPAVAAYEDNSTTEITAGITLTVDFDTRTGLNHLRIVATGANGYEAGKSYALVITTGTVDSVSVVGEVVGNFTLERSSLANDAITASKIAADAVGASELATDAIGAAEIGSAAIGADEIATDAIGAAELAASAIGASEVATDAIDRDAFAPDSGFKAIRSATAQAGAAGTITLDASASATDDIFNGQRVVLTGVTGAGQDRVITDYVGSTKVATIAPNWTTNPDATSTFAILPNGSINLSAWKLAAPNDLVSSRVDASVGAMAADVVTASAIATDAIGAAEVAASALTKGTEIAGFNDLSAAQVNAEVDTALDTAIPASPTAGSINERIRDLDDFFVIRRNTAQAGAASTITLDASASATDDFYNEYWIRTVSGTGPDQTRTITDYVGSTKVATITPNWLTNPDATTVFIVVGIGRNDALSAGTTDWSSAERNQVRQALGIDGTKAATSGGNLDTVLADTNDIQTRLPAALVSGRVDASVGAMATDVVTASAIALDAIGASEVAASALTKGTEIAGFNDLSAAQVNTEVDTAITDARLDELLNADSDIDGVAPPTVGSVVHELLTKTAASFTYDQTTDSLEAVRDNMGTAQTGDSFARLGAPAGASVSADIAAIEGQTDDIGVAGAGLTAIPMADLKKNTALANFPLLMVDSTDHVTPKTGLTITGQISCDAGAFANVTGTIAEVGSGIYQFDAAAADTNCDLATWKFTATGADTFFFKFRTK